MNDWREKISALSENIQEQITECFSDFNLLCQRAFSNSSTYIHTSNVINEPTQDLDKYVDLPDIPETSGKRNLIESNIYLSCDGEDNIRLGLNDDELSALIDEKIYELLILNGQIENLRGDVSLYKSMLSSLIDAHISKRHSLIRFGGKNGSGFLREKESISFREFFSVISRNLQELNADYWSAVCRQNFELAFNKELKYLVELERFDSILVLAKVRSILVNRYFPDCIPLMKILFPHVVDDFQFEHQFYQSISNPEYIRKVFLKFVQGLSEIDDPLEMMCKDGESFYRSSCIDICSGNDPEIEEENIKSVQLGLEDNMTNNDLSVSNYDHLVIYSDNPEYSISSKIEKYTEIPEVNYVDESKNITCHKEVMMVDYRKALGDINE